MENYENCEFCGQQIRVHTVNGREQTVQKPAESAENISAECVPIEEHSWVYDSLNYEMATGIATGLDIIQNNDRNGRKANEHALVTAYEKDGEEIDLKCYETMSDSEYEHSSNVEDCTPTDNNYYYHDVWEMEDHFKMVDEFLAEQGVELP